MNGDSKILINQYGIIGYEEMSNKVDNRLQC